MDFQDGELVRVSFSAKAAFIENGIYKTATEPSKQKIQGIIVSGYGLAKDLATVEFVPVGNCTVEAEKRNSTLLQLVDPHFEDGLSVECGLISTSPKALLEKLDHTISDSNLCLIKNCVQSYLEGQVQL
ncbi:MAG: hypothetical protein IPP97_16235 [Candidatus Obscuribacter sp.]|jgi:hypothetical protein|nr:hypothetical protein [Candidatus Obscuribacter sp.]MBP6350186.1 hypothetical protein [Candidatus Obscuribacter sp.]MBP6593550.1 hypothetical protein [Candidatus Obscuribacter sp.]MBP7576587.1 hypothetical protein [Candidatus Obscuribacter sp.]